MPFIFRVFPAFLWLNAYPSSAELSKQGRSFMAIISFAQISFKASFIGTIFLSLGFLSHYRLNLKFHLS